MRSHQSIIAKSIYGPTIAAFQDKPSDRNRSAVYNSNRRTKPFLILILIFLFSFNSYSQKIAILAPLPTPGSESTLAQIDSLFSTEFDVIEPSMSDMIFAEKQFERPFNLSTEDAINFGESVGSNYFLLIKTDTLRRTSFEREKYFESYIVYYLVSSRTGKLLSWKLYKYEEDSPEKSLQKLRDSFSISVGELIETIRASDREMVEKADDADVYTFEADLADSEDFRPPMPYLRRKPAYTKIAGIYDVLATVDAAVDIDRSGNVKNVEVLRWAGFGLDESVIETIRDLKWRPADLKGKPLAMRVLLRYNFKNIDTESEINDR